MVIMILFHSSGYRCLKHFYLEKVCKHMRHLFPEVVSYNRWSSESRSQTCLDYAEISCKREQSQACLAVPSASTISQTSSATFPLPTRFRTSSGTFASVNKANHISIMHWHIYYEAFSRYNIVCADLNPAFGLVTQLGQ